MMRVTTYTYGDAETNSNALRTLGQRDLGTLPNHLFVAKCLRALKRHLDVLGELSEKVQKSHMPADAPQVEDGAQVKVGDIFDNPIQMSHEQAALRRTVIHDDVTKLDGIELPGPVTEAMLPKKTKTKPDNDEGLANIIADLGVFYALPDDEG